MEESREEFEHNPTRARRPEADSLKTARDSNEASMESVTDTGSRSVPPDIISTSSVISGTHSPKIKSQAKIENAKSFFYKIVLPVAVAIALTCWVIQLNSVTKPIEKISTNVEHLAKENEKMTEKLDDISKPIGEMISDIEHLTNEDEKLNRKTESIEERIDKIVKPIENIREDIDELIKEDEKLNEQIKELREQKN